MAGDSNKKGFSGLSDLVSEVSDIDEPIIPKPIPKAETQPSTPKQSPQPQQVSAPSKPDRETTSSSQPVKAANSGKKDEGSIGKWIVIFLFIAVISFVMTNLISKDRQQSHKRYSSSSPSSSQTHKAPQSSSVPSAKAPNSTKSAGLQYTKPSVGTNNLLSTPEIRWCVRENIRIDAMRNVMETNTGIDDFNRIVNDYNNRCGNYRYRQGTQAQAERDVEPYRNQIVSAAVQEASQMNQLGSYNAASESTSLTQRRSLEEQQSNAAPNTPFEVKESPAPFFNISDLDCQKSPVMCKDQAKRPVSGVVLTFDDDNSLKKASAFLNGSSHGPTISFHQNGGINWITNFKNGRMDGPSIQFYENPSGTIGSIKWIIPFSNGLAEGIRRGYYETGELKSETSYTRGKESGFLYEFYKNGYLKSTEQYFEGKTIDEKTPFSPNTQRKDHVQPRPSELSAIEDLERQALKLLDQLTSHTPAASGSSAANVPKVPNAQYIKEAQQLLTDLGYSPGPVDGEYGSRTADAIKNFQRDIGINQDGLIDADMVRALRIIKDKGALIFLCLAYESGDGISRDISKAAQCIQKEAELGRVGAQVIIGIKYQVGEGVPIDYAKAAQWFQKAVDQGDAEAQNRLGTMYVNGQGVIKDRQRGCNLLRASAKQGHKEATENHNRVCAGASSAQSGYGSAPNINSGRVSEGSISASSKSSSPSFDCTKASNPVERTICGHTYLAELDSRMVAEYRRMLNGLDATGQSALRAEQRQWLRERNKCSQAVDIESCLTERYNARLIQLR